jgi:hypothetical protein
VLHARECLSCLGDGRDVASHAGSRLLADLADRSGLTEALGDALAGLRSRRSGPDPGRVLVDVAVMLAEGGVAISDLAVLRDQTGAVRPVASAATAWRVLDAVDQRLLEAVRRATRSESSLLAGSMIRASTSARSTSSPPVA